MSKSFHEIGNASVWHFNASIWHLAFMKLTPLVYTGDLTVKSGRTNLMAKLHKVPLQAKERKISESWNPML